jgi:hypothetical protein
LGGARRFISRSAGRPSVVIDFLPPWILACRKRSNYADSRSESRRYGEHGTDDANLSAKRPVAMTTIALYGLATFAALFGGGILGLLAGKLMPEKYHDDSTRAIVQTATGMVSLLAALVLGLLVATAKNKFDTSNKQTEEYAASLMLLDRELVNFGPGANETKSLLRKYTAAKIAETWRQTENPKPKLGSPPAWQLLESLQLSIRDLKPEFEAQRSALANASSIAAELNKTTWLERAEEMDHVQHPFILILLAWFAILFFSIGLFAPRNGLVIAALVVGALSIAGAVVLIADLDSPFEGILVVSAEPMQEALARISAP